MPPSPSQITNYVAIAIAQLTSQFSRSRPSGVTTGTGLLHNTSGSLDPNAYIGTSLQQLRTNAAGTDVEWFTATGGSPPSGTGLAFVTSGAWGTTIAAGTNGYVLTMVSGAPAWAPASGGGTVPTGTGFYHVTSGSQDGAARAVVLNSGDVTGQLLPGQGGTGLGGFGTAYQTLRTNAAASAIEWGPVNLASANAVTGTLPTGNLPNLAGDCGGAPGANVVTQLTGATGTVTCNANLQFGLSATAPTINQVAQATTPQLLTVQAANVTTGTGSGLDLSSGTGSVAAGSVRVRPGGVTITATASLISCASAIAAGTAAAVSATGTVRLPDNCSINGVTSGVDRPMLAYSSGTLVIGDASVIAAIINRVSAAGTIYNQANGANWLTVANGGVQLGSSTFALGGGSGVLGVTNAGTNPTSNPTGGGVLYATAGAGTWRGSSGTVTTFGPADPHCPNCARDFALDWENEDHDEHVSICIPCMLGAMAKMGIDTSKFTIRQRLSA